ncbi:outer membrane lipoprotein chaperone LolA, partial [Aduncisulcus paluster]
MASSFSQISTTVFGDDLQGLLFAELFAHGCIKFAVEFGFDNSIAVEDALTTEIQKTYDSIKTFKADFTQTLTNAASKEQDI